MLANPPFGVEWKQQQRYIEQEKDSGTVKDPDIVTYTTEKQVINLASTFRT
jgi:hypothetical protein